VAGGEETARTGRFRVVLALAVGGSLVVLVFLLAGSLAAAAMLAFPGRAARAALQVRSLLDGAVIAAGPSWPWSC
jgi:hypothetical protein